MMRKPVLLLVGVMLLSCVAAAAPTRCPGLVSLQILTSAAYADGCFVQDKLFDNFGYIQGGALNPTAGMVYTSFSVTPGPNSPEGDLHTIGFSASGRNWTLPFTITYDISLYLAPVGTSIVEASFDLNVPGADTAPIGTQTMVGVGNYLLTATVPSPGMTNIANEIALAVNLEVNPGGQRVSNLVNSYTQDFTAPVPESATIGLVGAGLVLIGLLRRRT